MEKMPLVSVCTPVYNGEKHIEDCVKAVLRQSYKNIEYIIVDNASNDNTAKIIENYIEKHPQIRVYKNQKTVCMEDNCNIAAQYCSDKTKWIKYAFCDDYLFPDCIEKMVEVGELDDKIGIISGYRIAGNIVTNTGLPIDQNIFSGSEILKNQILRKLHVASSSPNTVMYNKRVFYDLKGFNRLYDHSDTEIAFRILDDYKLGFVHYVITKSGREKGGGEAKSVLSGNKILEYLDFGYKNINKYKSITLSQDEINYLRNFYSNEIANFIIEKLASKEFQNIKKMIDNAPDEIKKDIRKLILSSPFKYIKKFMKFSFR